MTERTQDAAGSLSTRLASLPAEFGAFSEIYERDIRPALVEQEVKRKAAWSKAKRYIAFGVLAAVLVGGLGILLFRSPFGLIPGGIACVALILHGFTDLNRVVAQAKQLMITPVADKFGITYNEEPSEIAETNLPKLRSLDLLPSWDRKSLQDEMLGVRNGTAFAFFEAHLEDRRTTTDSKGRTKTQWVTVFRGQCWVFDAPKSFHSTTKVTRDSGIFNALGGLGSKFSRVRLEDPEFEKRFEVYGTDQVEARFLLTPDVMQAILDLETTFRGGKIRCAFDENQILVACEGRNLFEPGSMFRSFDEPDRVGDLLEDFVAMFYLIDVLGKK